MRSQLITLALLGGLTVFSLAVTEALLNVDSYQTNIYQPEQVGEEEPRWLVVKKINVSGNSVVESQSIEEQLSWFIGKRVWEVSEQEVLTQLLREPLIREATVHLGYLSGELDISVVEEELSYTTESGGSLWLLSREGAFVTPLAETLIDAGELPKIVYQDEGIFTFGVSCLTRFDIKKSIPYQIEEVRFQENWFELVPFDFENNPRVLVPYKSGSNYQEEINNFSALLAQLKKEGLKAGEVDLRFSNKAIVRKASAA